MYRLRLLFHEDMPSGARQNVVISTVLAVVFGILGLGALLDSLPPLLQFGVVGLGHPVVFALDVFGLNGLSSLTAGAALFLVMAVLASTMPAAYLYYPERFLDWPFEEGELGGVSR